MAIVGSGDIASVLPESEKLFFASGVSNSQCLDESEYLREVDLLLAQDRLSHIVYFSSLAVFYSNTRYTKHKLFMEDRVKAKFPAHTIVRLGNIWAGRNPHTLINFFKAELAAGRQPELRDEYRYLVDKEEFLYWIGLIPGWSCEMNITGRRLKVPEIWEMVKRGEL